MSLSGDYEAALEGLQAIAEEHPSAQYLNDLGVTYLRKVTPSSSPPPLLLSRLNSYSEISSLPKVSSRGR